MLLITLINNCIKYIRINFFYYIAKHMSQATEILFPYNFYYILTLYIA